MPPDDVTQASILWRRLDAPGHEFCRLVRQDSTWQLAGTAAFAQGGLPCELGYLVLCDAAWRTLSARVTGSFGRDTVDIAVSVDAAGIWRLNGRETPAVAGAVDVDLSFSPSTNLLPIRRLALAVGRDARVRAAWLRFPELVLEPLEQLYRRTGETTYRYESRGGEFVTELEVNAAGLVTRYGELWRAEAEHVVQQQ